MIINQEILDKLCESAGEARTEKAKSYKKARRVTIKNIEYENQYNFEVSGIVVGTEPYRTYIHIKNGEVEDITCECQDYYNTYGVCKHTLATVMELTEERNKIIENTNIEKMSNRKENSNEYRNFRQLVTTFYNEEIEAIEDEETEIKNKGTIKLEPKIFYDKFTGDMKVEFKIGNKRMYKIKDLSEFYTRMINKEFYNYGQKLQFIHTREIFEEESQKLLDFVMKYAEIIKYANSMLIAIIDIMEKH